MNIKKINFKDKKIQTGAIIILVTAIVSFLLYQNVIGSKKKDLETLIEKYEKKQATLNGIFAMRPHLQELRENVAMLNTKLDSLKSIFPDQKEVPKLVKEMVRVAHKSGIVTNKFTPLPPIIKEYYVENIDDVKIEGGYHELARFFNYLAEFEMIINVSKVKMSISPRISSEITAYKEYGNEIKSLEATFNMTTFSSKK